MNVKKVFRSLLVILTCCLSLSCVLDVLPENKTGSVSFTLPQTNVNTRSPEASSAVYPEVYKIVMTSVDKHREVYNEDRLAGKPVTIPGLDYGKYQITVSGNTDDKYFKGSVDVDINQPSVSAEIKLESFKRFGSIDLSVDVRKNPAIKEVVYNVYQDDVLIKSNVAVPVTEGKGLALITGLYLGSKYYIEVRGSDGKYVYVGRAPQTPISLNDKEPTKLDFNEFIVVTGNILLIDPKPESKTLVGNTVIVKSAPTDNAKSKIIKTLKFEEKDYNAESKGYLITNLTAGGYDIEFQSSVDTEVYSLAETINVVPGTDVPNKKSIVIKNRDVFYVSATGKDDNPGTYSAPFRTISHAVNKAPTTSQIILKDEIFDNTNDNVTVTDAKELEIVSLNEKGSEYNIALVIENEAAHIGLTNITINSAAVNNGQLAIRDNTVIQTSVNVNAGSLTLSNPSYIGAINLVQPSYIDILGELPLSFSTKLDITNESINIESPVLKNNSTNTITPKNIASFVLSEKLVDYTINNFGKLEKRIIQPEIPEITKTTLTFNNLNDTVTPSAGLKAVINNSVDVPEEVVLDTLPKAVQLKPGIYKVKIVSDNTNEIVYLPNGSQEDYIEILKDTPKNIDLRETFNMTFKATIPTKGLFVDRTGAPDEPYNWFRVILGEKVIYSEKITNIDPAQPNVVFTTSQPIELLRSDVVTVEIVVANEQMEQKIYTTKVSLPSIGYNVDVGSFAVNTGYLVYNSSRATIVYEEPKNLNINEYLGFESQKGPVLDSNLTDSVLLPNGDAWLLGGSTLVHYKNPVISEETKTTYDLSNPSTFTSAAFRSDLGVYKGIAEYKNGVMLVNDAEQNCGYLYLVTPDETSPTPKLNVNSYRLTGMTASVIGPNNNYSIEEIVFDGDILYAEVLHSERPSPEMPPIETRLICKGQIQPNSTDIEIDFTTTPIFNQIDKNMPFNNHKFDITDLQVVGTDLYALLIDTTSVAEHGDNSRGALLKIDQAGKKTVVGLLETSIISVPETNPETGETKNIPMYMVEKTEDYPKYFLGPRKFIAIKPDELVIADAGGVVSGSGTANKLQDPELKRRIITVDLNKITEMNVTEIQEEIGTESFGGGTWSGYYQVGF